jgi:hypothetical protein
MQRNARSMMLALSLAAIGACTAYIRPDGSIAYIQAAPPAVRIEVRESRPSTRHVWVDGHWEGRGQEYVWVSGRWIMPDNGRRQWVAGSWRHDRNGWFWVEGHWR